MFDEVMYGILVSNDDTSCVENKYHRFPIDADTVSNVPVLPQALNRLCEKLRVQLIVKVAHSFTNSLIVTAQPVYDFVAEYVPVLNVIVPVPLNDCIVKVLMNTGFRAVTVNVKDVV